MSWFLIYGEWPTQLNHRCNNPPCVNPEHLYEGSARDNTLDIRQAGNGRYQKLHAGDVEDIRTFISEGFTDRWIANNYGVKPRAIYNIRKGLRWKD